MRKLVLTAALVSAIAFANAQGLTSKNGTPILPEAEDWSIGFDAAPLLNYFGNMFNNSTNNSISMDYPSNNPLTIVGKYVVDENKAYRGKVALNFSTNTATAGALTDSIHTPSEVKTGTNNITIGAGIQNWRGKGRLKGYYGAEAMIGFGGGTKVTNTYSKALSPTSIGDSRTMETKSGSIFGFGIDGFIGIEYFFAPKMSLSAEYTWGIAIASGGSSETTTESVNANGTIASTTTEGGKTSDFNVGVGNTVTPNVTSSSSGSGSIVLSFYF